MKVTYVFMITILIIFFVSISGCTGAFSTGGPTATQIQNASPSVNASLTHNNTTSQNHIPTPTANLIGTDNTGLAEPSIKTSAGTSITPTPTKTPTPGASSIGIVTGRVLNNNVGVGGAYVAIVDANDHAHVYYTTTSSSSGSFQFSNVDTTGGQLSYVIYAKQSILGEGYSYPFMVSQYTVVVNVGVSTSTSNTPTPSAYPAGSITGRVTTQNTTIGIAGASVAVVDSWNSTTILYSTTADSQGYYQFTGIPQTSGQTEYMLWAHASGLGEGYSHSFSVIAGATSVTSIVIFALPAHITLSGGNTVHADGVNNTTITAYVTDSLGSPVANGWKITYSESDTSTGGWFSGWATGPLVTTISSDTYNKGYATMTWGWATKTGTVTITATSDLNPSVHSSMDINVVP